MRAPAIDAPFIPQFLEGGAGPVFTLYYPPAPAADRGLDLVYVPPFAEEMNRARRMAALQARALAAVGVGVLVVDLFGTGDSAGAFRDAEWPVWRRDALAGVSWLEAQGRRRIGLWGLRFGGLLAMSLVADEPGRFDRVLLWAPVTSGHAMLTQFLRIRIAASMGGAAEDTRTLRARLAAGEAIDVAGYALPPGLAATLDGLGLADLPPPPTVPVDWIHLAADAAHPIMPQAQKVIDAWREAGAAIAWHAATGDPFWSLLDITLAPDLIDVTTRVIAGAGADADRAG